jgi:thiamine biosynthesis lipoprotein
MGTKHYLCTNYFCEIMEKLFKVFKYLSFILVLIFFSTCKNKENPELKKYTLNGRTQGTYYHIVYYAPEDKWCVKNNWQTSSQIKKGIDSILIKIDNSISLWNPQSLLNKINDNQTNVMNTILKENFLAAEKISKLTDGNFDISLGALIEAHGFAAKERKKLSKQEIDSMMLYVGYKKLRLEDDKLIKQYPQTKIDFNAIAQGYTTDQISNYLKRNNINQHIVDVGGEVFASGKKPDGQQWRVAIEEPSKDMYAEREYNSFIKLENKSIVTSGNYRKYIEEDGIRLSHTINPKTGYSVSHNLLSVSVIAQDATTADGLATAFMVMGKEKAEEFLNTHPEYDAIFIYSTKEGEIETSHTKNLDQILEKAE